MADVSKIKLPNGTTYIIKDNNALPLTGGSVTGPVSFGDSVSIDEATVGDLVVNGGANFTNGVKADTYNGGHPIYFIKGTQTASTNLWTGDLPNGVIYYNGLVIDYLLPYAGTSSAATLNLSGLGAKPVYYGNSATGAVTTHYGANTVIHLTYIIDSAFNSGNGCWKASNYYDSNTVSQLRWDYSTVYAGTAGIFPYTLIMMNSSGNYESIVTSSSTGTSKARNTVGFVPGTLLIYYASGTTTNGNKISASNYGVYQAYNAADFRYSANISTSALTVGKPVYLVGTITDGLFYLDSTWWTQTLPTSDNGKVYMYIGDTYNIASATTDYRVNVAAYHPMYWYKNEALRQYGNDAGTINGLTVQTAVPSGAKFTDTVTTATTTGSGNAVTAITASNGALTVTKGTTFLTSHQDISGKADKATTLAGYGITDAKIASGTITLGSNTITPLTSSSTLNAAKLSGAIPSAVTATTQASTDNSTKIATTAYVTTAIANLPEPMIFKGSVGTGGTITSLPTAAASNEGHTYKVITALSSPSAKVGDTVISNGSEWIVIPSGDEPSGTVTSVGISNGGGLSVSGSPVTSSGIITISHADTSSQSSSSNSGRTYIQSLTLDTYGHVTGISTATETVTNTDEKLKVAEVTSATQYYPIVGANSTTAATRQFDTTGFKYYPKDGTTSTVGTAELTLGNSTASGTAGNKQGTLKIYGSTAYAHTIQGAPTAARTLTLPNNSGTIALTSDLSNYIPKPSDNGYYGWVLKYAGPSSTFWEVPDIYEVGVMEDSENPGTYTLASVPSQIRDAIYNSQKLILRLVLNSGTVGTDTISPDYIFTNCEVEQHYDDSTYNSYMVVCFQGRMNLEEATVTIYLDETESFYTDGEVHVERKIAAHAGSSGNDGIVVGDWKICWGSVSLTTTSASGNGNYVAPYYVNSSTISLNYTALPYVWCQVMGGWTGSRYATPYDIDETGFKIRLYASHKNSTDTVIRWLAIGKA